MGEISYSSRLRIANTLPGIGDKRLKGMEKKEMMSGVAIFYFFILLRTA
jgi:hypothetical protein